MGAKTGIAWTDSTWNPLRGCSMAKGSEAGGCLNCYAARLHARGLPALLSPEGKPLARILDSGPRWTGEVSMIEKHLLDPMKWKKPRRIFVNSLSDLFHEAVPDEWIDRIFAVMALCPQHTFQVFTKRPNRMLSWATEVYEDGKKIGNEPMRDCLIEGAAQRIYADRNPGNDPSCWLSVHQPLTNVHLYVSVEDQTTADARIPLLLRTPAAVRGVSYEPALGPVDFDSDDVDGLHALGCGDADHKHKLECRGLDHIIVGGESGPGARSFNVQWALDTIRQGREAGVPVFVKQMGARPFLTRSTGCDSCDSTGHTLHGFQDCERCHGTGSSHFVPDYEFRFKHRAGADLSEWPEDLRVQMNVGDRWA